MAASEAFVIEKLDGSDTASGMALSTEAGWNQNEADWRHFITQGATFGVRAPDGALVASAAALPYDGPFGYVGMVLVTPSWRRRGLATALVDRCISELRGRGLVPMLDATADGAAVYRRQGFLGQFEFDRWEGTIDNNSPDEAPPAARALLHDLDAAAFGARRPALLDDFTARPGTRAVGDGQGFAMVREGRRALQLGPAVATDERAALDMIERLFSTRRGLVFIDVPRVWRGIGAWLVERGFAIQRSFTRMALGRAAPFGRPDRLFAVAGPEFG